MPKIRKILVMVAIMLFVLAGKAAAAGFPIELRLDTREIKPPIEPVIINGSTLVPVRIIAEEMGLNVEWDGAAQAVTISNASVQINLTLNSNTAYVNGQPFAMTTPAQIIGEYTMVPLRFVGEAMGLEVVWNDQSRIVSLYNTSRKVNGQTGMEHFVSQTITRTDTFKFTTSSEENVYVTTATEYKGKRYSGSTINGIYKDGQYYTDTTFVNPNGVVHVKMFFDPPKVYGREDGKFWEELDVQDFGPIVGNLIGNLGKINQPIVDRASFTPESKIFYGEDQVIDGQLYHTLIFDVKGLGAYNMVKEFIDSDDVVNIPISLIENYELIEYDYLNKDTLKVERRKIIFKLEYRDMNRPPEKLTFVLEQDHKFYDFDKPVVFPDQPQ